MEDIKTILCVDDDEPSLLVLRAYIDALGSHYVSLEAKSGKDCLKIISQHYVDLIILDHSLGDMNGVNVCEDISSVSMNPDVPIIIVSMIDRQDLSSLYNDKNVVKISQKPYMFDQFRQEVSEVLLT